MRPRLKRLFRFSLRTFFVLATMLCVLIGLKVRQVNQQKEAVAWVVEHGGTIRYEHEIASVSNMNRQPPGPIWLRDFLGEDYFITPYSVTFLHSPLGDVSQLRNLPTLTYLALCSEDITDIAPLAELQELRVLVLQCHNDCDLSPVKKLKQLKGLVVFGASHSELADLRKALPHCDVSNTI